MLWLTRSYTGDHDYSPRNVHTADSYRLPQPSDAGWGNTVAMLAGDAFRWSFVRHPIARAESAYRDKVVRQSALRPVIQRTLGMAEDREAEVSFEMFVDALEQTDPLDMDVHWRPQHLNLMHGLVEYDLIGRLESFDADFARMREATKMPEAPFEIRNVRARAGESLTQDRPDLRRRLESVYARDFEVYGY